jgi:hypothetical protein
LGLTLLGLLGLSLAQAEPEICEEPDTEAQIAELEARIARLEAAAAPTAPIVWGPATVEAGATRDQLLVVGGPLRVDGEVRGAAVVLGGDLEVGGAGRVGRALALGGAVDVEPGGVAPTWPVATLRMPTPASPAAPPRSTLLDDLRSLAQRGATYLSFTGLGVLLVGRWPRRALASADGLGQNLGWYVLGGAVLSASGLALTGGLTLTVIGAPLALLIAMGLVTAWFFGLVSLCLHLGSALPAQGSRPDWLSFLLGAGLLCAITAIPWVGGLLFGLLSFAALTAGVVSRLGGRSDPGLL